MILNCRRVALAYSEEKVIFGLHPRQSLRAREEQAGRLDPSQSLLRNASSPERGSFICANRKKKKAPPSGELAR